MHYRLSERVTEIDKLDRTNAIYVINTLSELLRDSPNGLAKVVLGEFNPHTGRIISISTDETQLGRHTTSGTFLVLKKDDESCYASPFLMKDETKLNSRAAQVIDDTIKSCNRYWSSL